ncbi:MAG: M48 family peptidase [Acidobacteria bacterium]|jgi:predicted metal-dependent hydrolase|nr:MAG: M48 family peptidase [Acidobacteriota bacterium]
MDRESFNTYVLAWAKRIGVAHKVKEIHLRPMKRKIASCSTKGRLTFDPSILSKDMKELDYIVVHELMHLRYPNHGKLFKAVLSSYLNSRVV